MARQLGDGVASCLKRQAASRVSHVMTKQRARTEGGNGKFGGLPGGPSGGSMGAGSSRSKRKGY